MNREKVERDLEILRRDLNAVVSALNNDEPTTSHNEETQTPIDEEQIVGNNNPEDLNNDVPASILNENATKSTAGGKIGETLIRTRIARTDRPTPPAQGSKPPETRAEAVSSTLAAVPTTSASSSASVTSPLNQNDQVDLRIKREIELVDLTDDPEPKAVKQESITGEKSSHLDQAEMAIIPQGNPPTLVQNCDFHGEASAFAPYGNHYPNQFAMPPGMMHHFYHPAMYPYNYGIANSNISAPAMPNNGQIPWPYHAPDSYNAPNIWNSAAANTQQLFAQLQPHY
ncbi:hypothetical protein QAD02_010318 [Eretmocerus hayati]|uniref:Uncharacterized protein n=1 Tax=Eretmocerus hayati TaxID=131215 RepID=A0ACC2NGD3_9HYME|nr:hypothetical protein QAD02_010318 [Eretmocerus hayati]